MGFYGECWMATDKTALEASLTDPNQQSSKCIGHDYKTCTDSSEHCMGGADSLYIYGFPSAAPARTHEYLLLFFFCFFFVYNSRFQEIFKILLGKFKTLFNM